MFDINFQLVPTRNIVERANLKGMDPYTYMETRTRTLNSEFKKGDKRLFEKNGLPMQDIAIFYSDGTRIQIHPIGSNVEGFSKVELYEYKSGEPIGNLIRGYLDIELDMAKMQTDYNYLKVVSSLIESKRLIRMKRYAQQHGMDEIYLGHVDWDNDEKRYKKYINKEYDVALEIIKDILERKQKEREKDEEKRNLIASIGEKIKRLPLEDLEDLDKAINARLSELGVSKIENRK